MILGLDVSTSTAGYCIVDNNIIMDFGWIDLTKCDVLKDKVYLIIEFIKKNKYFTEIKYINLESALMGFSRGFTSQMVIIKLIRMNCLLEYILGETFVDKKLTLIGAMTARKKVFGKARVKNLKPKLFVRQQLDLKFDLSKHLIKNRIGNEDKRNEDALDALVLALCN